MVQISANVLINYILIFFILLLFLVLTRRLSNKEVGDGYFVMLKSQNTFNLSLSFYASGMGLWIIASPAEVGWYGLGFDVIGYACLLYTSPSPRDLYRSRMPSSA